MSKADRARKRQTKRFAKPSLPRAIGANDNIEIANDNAPPVMLNGVRLTDGQAYRFMVADQKVNSRDLDLQRDGQRMMRALEQELEIRQTEKSVKEGLHELKGL